MISLKSPRELEIMARGGAILAATLDRLSAEVRPGITTKELDEVCEAFIRSHEGAKPAFKGLYGFPASACISVNEEIVHGIPAAKRVVKEGDVVKLEVGVNFEGYFTDAAVTVPAGVVDAESQRLMDVTKAALEAGVDAARVGKIDPVSIGR